MGIRAAKRAASGTRSEAIRVPGERSEPDPAREAKRAGCRASEASRIWHAKRREPGEPIAGSPR